MPAPDAASAAAVVSVAMSSSFGNFPFEPGGRRVPPPGRKDQLPVGSDGEHQQKRDEEREDPQSFRERDTDEHGRCLAAGGRGVAQCTREEVANHVAHTNGCPAHARTGQTGTDICTHLYDVAFHFDSPYVGIALFRLSIWQ